MAKMGKLFGVEWGSPYEIEQQQLQQIASQKQQATQAGNMQAAHAAEMRRMAISMVGTKESRKAARIEGLFKSAMESNPQEEGESQIAYQQRLRSEVLPELSKIDPIAAVGMADSIVALRDAEVARTGQELGNKKAKTDARLRRTFVLDAGGGQTYDGQTFYDEDVATSYQSAEAELKRLRQEAIAKNDQGAIEALSKVRISPIQNVWDYEPTGGRSDSLSQISKFAEPVEAATQSATAIVQLSEALGDNMFGLIEPVNTLQAGAKVVQDTLTALGSTVAKQQQQNYSEFLDWGRKLDNIHELPPGVDDVESFITWQDQKFDSAWDKYASEGSEYSQAMASWMGGTLGNLADEGTSAQYLKAQVKLMAYTLAKTLDPGGRLSDQDVEMAMEMIIGGGSPEVITKRLKERIESTYKHLGPRVETLDDEERFGTYGPGTVKAYKAEMARAQEAVKQLLTQVQERKLMFEKDLQARNDKRRESVAGEFAL